MNIDFNGSYIQLQLFTPVFELEPAVDLIAIVDEGIEFNVPRFDPDPNDNEAVVGFIVDIVDNSIIYQINQDFPSTFLDGDYDGYVFTDIFGLLPAIENVSIDLSFTTLDIGATDISFTEDTISINVEGVPFEPGEGIKLNVDFAAPVSQSITTSKIFNYSQFLRFRDLDPATSNDTVNGLPMALLFDENYYLNQNPDVFVAIKQGFIASGYQHFLLSGIDEGRNPSPIYNEQFYRANNFGVDQAIEFGLIESGLKHFLLFGHEEGRDPSKLFSQSDYLTNNSEVADAVESSVFKSAFEHYIEHGLNEGRFPELALFSEAYYLQQNPDVATAVGEGDFTDGFQHFISLGQSEGRNPNSSFNQSIYLSVNPDVQEAVANGLFASGFEHYEQFGRFEVRSIS